MQGIGFLSLSGVVIVIVLFTLVLYRGEAESRERNRFTASYGIIFFVAVITGSLIVQVLGLLSSISMFEQILDWISVLVLSLYNAYLLQDVQRDRKEYRTKRNQEFSVEIATN